MILKEIQDDKFAFKIIYITGISNVRINFNQIQDLIAKLCNKNQVIIQFFNSQLIAGWEHLFFSAVHSLKTFKQGRNLSNKLDLEILLYASGQRQIKKAIKKIGIGLETQNIAILIMGNSIETIESAKLKIFELIKGTEDESILDINKNKYEKISKAFNITPLEIETTSNSSEWKDKVEALGKIVLNRIAFVVFEK